MLKKVEPIPTDSKGKIEFWYFAPHNLPDFLL